MLMLLRTACLNIRNAASWLCHFQYSYKSLTRLLQAPERLTHDVS